MKIALCGSVSFAKKIIKIKGELTDLGFDVVAPANIDVYADGKIKVEDKWKKLESDVLRNYAGEIKKSDAVLIVNQKKNDIENYIGGNSLIEMAFAYVNEKKIYLLNPIPKMAYSDEIGAMKPTVINGDLSKVK